MLFRWIAQFDRLLRGELIEFAALRLRGLEIPLFGFLVIIDLLGMVYGACMGIFALTTGGSGAAMQIPASMVKVPALYLLTLVVTLPSLYVFNALLGSRLSLTATARLLVCSLAVMLAVLSSGGPIVGFFSLCTSSYSFMILLNVLVFALAGFFGLSFLLKTLNRMTLVNDSTATEPAGSPPETDEPLLPSRQRRSNRSVLRIWLVVFALVGAQMGWVLRPFVGKPGMAFTWFRPRESNFFQAVVGDVKELLMENAPGDALPSRNGSR